MRKIAVFHIEPFLHGGLMIAFFAGLFVMYLIVVVVKNVSDKPGGGSVLVYDHNLNKFVKGPAGPDDL